MTLFAALAVPVRLSPQDNTSQANTRKHHHYKLIDIETFGGPTSGVNEPSFATDASRALNAREMVGVSATSIPITATSSPFDCGAFVNHAFVSRMRMAIDLIPCDENHPNIEGCDYDMVDGSDMPATQMATTAKPVLSPDSIRQLMQSAGLRSKPGIAASEQKRNRNDRKTLNQAEPPDVLAAFIHRTKVVAR
jgi:hypothetical protein